jgi:hypothetical protein
MESTKEIHHVCSLQEGHPNQVLVPAGTVGDCGEAYLGAQSGEEYMLVDKETIYCQFDILSENLDNTLRHKLAIPLDCIPFHLKDRLAPDYICGFDIIDGHICSWNTTSANNRSCLVCSDNLALAEQLHVVMHSLD